MGVKEVNEILDFYICPSGTPAGIRFLMGLRLCWVVHYEVQAYVQGVGTIKQEVWEQAIDHGG
jgi:hypothetical protein